MSCLQPLETRHAPSAFLGLAPFLRRSIAGEDLAAFSQQLLAPALDAPGDANQLMNLSIAAQCVGQRETGLALQQQALLLQRTYHLPAAVQPACLRLLLLVTPGDLSANTPLDCLFEHSDLDLTLHFVDGAALPALHTPEALAAQLPPHDVLMVGIGVSNDAVPLLHHLRPLLARWPQPVINAPEHILHTDRARASALLQEVAGLQMPATVRCIRSTLLERAGAEFPLIVRPVNSQGGHGLELVQSRTELSAYLQRMDSAEFFIAPFVDYRGADGHFRKIRIALIHGKAYACHMAVSSHWMVHYVNAGMYEETWKRAEEAVFMDHFDAFAQRHHAALQAIYTRCGLDYVGIDCAETRDGQLLVFEIDHAMVIHAMDLEQQFPFKQVHIEKVRHALREFILSTLRCPA